jgi:hypothetical protein
MEGYEVITSDDCKFGRVVAESGGNLIVEHGTLRKSRRPLPRTFAEIHDDEQVVRATVSKEVLESAPACDGDGVDDAAVAEHYGLAEAFEAPETQGYGEVLPDDPARTAYDDARSAGIDAPEEQRVATRQNMDPGQGPNDGGGSPGLLGGDRFRDAG